MSAHLGQIGGLLPYLGIFAAVIGLAATSAAGQTTSTTRIVARDGWFVEESTGNNFALRGFNYIRLFEDRAWHSTFCPGHWEPDRAQAALAHISDAGFTTVRVFLNPFPGEGIVADRDATDLSDVYMQAVIAFLQAADKHDLRVVFSVGGLPWSKRYRDIIGQVDDQQIARRNRVLLHEPTMNAKAQFMADFTQAIKDRAPHLLPTVLSYEIDNEINFRADHPPFSLREGSFIGINGKSYDLTSEQAHQELADDHTLLLVNRCVEAVKAVDPDAMVSVNVFTFAAVGRSGPAKTFTDRTRDNRFPARPLILAQSAADYVDVHFYPFEKDTFQRDLESIEWPQTRAAAAERGIPMICGEFGAFKDPFPRMHLANRAMKWLLGQIYDAGFVGYLYWTYDTDRQPFLWNAMDHEAEIFQMLGEMHQHQPQPGPSNQGNAAPKGDGADAS